jgi:uncharacterized protein (DUF58 family)
LSVRRSLLLGLLIYGLIIAGLATLNAAILALALPLVIYVAAVVIHQPEPLNLEITRMLSDDYVNPGTTVEVTLIITNRGGALDEVLIQDLVPLDLRVDGDSSVILGLDAGESYTLTYTVTGERGTYRFRSVHVTAYEHLGLFRREERYPVVSKLSVLPNALTMRSIMIRPLRTRGFAGPIPSREGGSGTDFFGVRTYQPGDPLRWINWRLSARHTKDLFINEFEQERITDVGLILDARERSNVVVQGESLFEHAVEAAAALAEIFLADGHRVGLLIYGRGLERILPGYGKHQRHRILRGLAQAQVGGSQVFDSLDYLPTRFFPAKSQIVLVSPLCKDDPPVLTRLRARGYEVLVISPDPVDFEARGLTARGEAMTQRHLAADLAARIARAERSLWIRNLHRVGIPVVNWPVDQPLDTTVHVNLKKTMAARQSHR